MIITHLLKCDASNLMRTAKLRNQQVQCDDEDFYMLIFCLLLGIIKTTIITWFLWVSHDLLSFLWVVIRQWLASMVLAQCLS